MIANKVLQEHSCSLQFLPGHEVFKSKSEQAIKLSGESKQNAGAVLAVDSLEVLKLARQDHVQVTQGWDCLHKAIDKSQAG